MSAVISNCGLYRYRLERKVQQHGIVFAYFGVNGSTATADEDDHTVRKWNAFTRIHGGRRYLVGNAFGFRARDVNKLARQTDPIGSENGHHLAAIMAEADVLVPCWGNRMKVPQHLRWRFDALRNQLFETGKPVRVFGFTKSGDPKHPLTLSYETPLTEWIR